MWKKLKKFLKFYLTFKIFCAIIINCSYSRFYGFLFVHNHGFLCVIFFAIMHYYCDCTGHPYHKRMKNPSAAKKIYEVIETWYILSSLVKTKE